MSSTVGNYPRNMLGYGERTPDPQWPGTNGQNSFVAVQFVLNYEEGGENNILHGDAASEAFLSEIPGAAPWVGQRHWNMESVYEYGSRAGFWRLHRLFTEREIPLTIYGVATAMERSPVQLKAMIDAGWEMASHGLKWVEHRDMPEAEERKTIQDAIRIHTQLTGERPLGWYTGRCSINTTKLIVEEGGFLYSSDDYSDDLPYWLERPQGGRHLIIPYTLDANDMRFATPQGFNSGEQFYHYLKDSFDCLYDEGKRGSPKMMSIGMHCRLLGRPGRVMALQRFVDYVRSHPRVWIPRRIDIAKHWHENF